MCVDCWLYAVVYDKIESIRTQFMNEWRFGGKMICARWRILRSLNKTQFLCVFAIIFPICRKLQKKYIYLNAREIVAHTVWSWRCVLNKNMFFFLFIFFILFYCIKHRFFKAKNRLSLEKTWCGEKVAIECREMESQREKERRGTTFFKDGHCGTCSNTDTHRRLSGYLMIIDHR